MKKQNDKRQETKRPQPRNLTAEEVHSVAGGPIMDNGGSNNG